MTENKESVDDRFSYKYFMTEKTNEEIIERIIKRLNLINDERL